MGRLAQLIQRFGTAMPPGLVSAPAVPTVSFVGSTRYVKLPPGIVGRIQMLRDGVPIAGAKSAGRVGDYLYKLQAADNGKIITAQVTDSLVESDGPRRFSMGVKESERNAIYIQYDEELQSLPAPSAFTVRGTLRFAKVLQSVSLIGTSLVKLVFNTNFVREDEPLLDYVVPGTNPIRDLLGNPAPAFTGVRVFLEMRNPDPLEEFGETFTHVAGGGGFVVNPIHGDQDALNYTAQAVYPWQNPWVRGGSGNAPTLVERDYGWVEMRAQDSLNVAREISLTDGGSGWRYEQPYGARLYGGVVQAKTNGTLVGSPFTFTTPSLDCIVMVMRNKDTSLVMKTSEDRGQTWTTRHTFATPCTRSMTARFATDSKTVPIIGVAGHGYHV